MKKRILFLTAALVIGNAAWMISVLFRPATAQQTPPRSGSARTLYQQEPVGWVFGRLVGVQQSVYAPAGPGVSLQGPPLPGHEPLRNQP
ncbi:MAG: hypothetical protein L0Z62_21055 [Gemmataceae bacterium]|nr:hypothetical protein [Gemmataceae bacterium]